MDKATVENKRAIDLGFPNSSVDELQQARANAMITGMKSLGHKKMDRMEWFTKIYTDVLKDRKANLWSDEKCSSKGIKNGDLISIL